MCIRDRLEARKSETGEWDVVRKEINSTRLGEGMTESASIADGSRHRTPVSYTHHHHRAVGHRIFE